jgi:hypothetical protein
VEDFDEVFVFTELVIDQNRAMGQFPHASPFANCAPHPRESSQQFHVVEQRITEALGSLGIVFGNMPDDFSEIT